MKKLMIIIFLLFSVAHIATAQTTENTAEFYSYLNTILKNKSNKSIQLLGTNYGTLGSKFNWEATFIKKEKYIEVVYKSQKPNEDDNLDQIVMQSDTTFVVKRNKLVQNFRTELKAIESRVVYFDLKVKITVNTASSNKEFTLNQAQGLSFLLRYNTSFETYYNIKSKNQ